MSGVPILNKVFSRFSKTVNKGPVQTFRIEQLTEHRFNEYIDFVIDHFVPHEMNHRLAGIYKNQDAIKEYRKFLTEESRNPSVHITICCRDDERYNKIVGCLSMSILKRGDICDDIFKQAKTTEVQIYGKIRQERNKLCSVQDIMNRYNADTIFSGHRLAVHPEYRGYRLTREFFSVRRAVCKHFNVPLTCGWMTAVGSQKVTQNDGWDVVYEISFDEIGKLTGILIDKELHLKSQLKVARIKQH